MSFVYNWVTEALKIANGPGTYYSPLAEVNKACSVVPGVQTHLKQINVNKKDVLQK